jgi:hypothetical protein
VEHLTVAGSVNVARIGHIDSASSVGVSDLTVRRGEGLPGLVGRVPTPLEEGG